MAKRFSARLLAAVQVVMFLLISTHAWASPATANQARQVVRGWLRQDGSPLRTHVGSSVARIETFSDAARQTLYYVVYLHPSGFVIVPADDEAEPIVCFAAAGTYDPSPANPLGALVSGDVAGRVKAVRGEAGAVPPAAHRSSHQGRWRQLSLLADGPVPMTGLGGVSDVRVAPFVQSRWNQQTENGLACYNYYAPPGAAGTASNYPSGCVATAMAQVMRYYQYPTNGVGVHAFTITVNGASQTAYTRGGDGSGGAYNWILMMLDPDYTIGAAQREAIGALCYDAGVAVKMQYAAGGSGAIMPDCRAAMISTFGFSNAIDSYNNNANIPATNLQSMINPNLDAGYPVILGITGVDSSNATYGHAVVPDGYGYSSSTLYHHLNMGWGGYQDAWYNLPTIDPSLSSPPGLVFNTITDCLYNMYPTGTGEIISGRVTDPSGNPLAGLTVTALRSGGATYTATTSSAGIYAFTKVPSSSIYTIGVSGGSYLFQNQTTTTGTSSDSTNYPGGACNSSGNRWGVDFPRRQLYTAYMSSNPGWTLDTGWAWGTPMGSGSHNGDPTSGFSGSSVIGYNLAGDYANRLSSTRYAKLGPVDCRNCQKTKLNFRRWLGVDVYSNDQANLQVSNNGASWTEIWNNAGGQVLDTAWQPVEYDISAIADNQPTVYIRWGLGPTNNSGTYPGWNIDDVEVTGLDMPPAVPGAPQPADGQAAVPVNAALSWSGAASGVTFDVYLDTVNPPVQKAAAGQTAAIFTPAPLLGATTYYWQVVAINAAGQTPGPVWSFRTYVQGDINSDGYVNIGDLQLLVAAWSSGPGYAGPADLSNDGYVNVGDLQILVGQWGKS